LRDARPAPARAPIDRQAEIERLDRLADLLDSRYRIPVVGWRFGWDAILGLVPVVGDLAVTLPSAYLVYRAHKLGLPRSALLGMVGNVALDTVAGSVPILGSVFDVAFKANRRNFALLRRHLSDAEAAEPRTRISAPSR
jgi:hypothetical protein